MMMEEEAKAADETKKAAEKKEEETKKTTEMKAEADKKAEEMKVDEAAKAAHMNMEDNTTNKKETTVQMMAQKMADLKKRKGARADTMLNPEVNKDDDSNNEDNGIADSAFT